MVTSVMSVMGVPMIGPTFFVRENGAKHGGHGFHLRLYTFQGSNLGKSVRSTYDIQHSI